MTAHHCPEGAWLACDRSLLSPVQTLRPRLLLVDDEPRLLSSLRALLATGDYELATATCGAEVIAAACATQFDLILLDLHLPDMDGHEVMDRLIDKNIDASVIVLSGDTSIDAPIGALRRGAYGYLRKPYAPEELLYTIENALQKRRLEAENRRISSQLESSEKMYRYLVDSSPDIIYTLSSSGRFTFINSRLQALLGIDGREMLGRHYSALIHEEDLERANLILQQQRERPQRSHRIELRFRPGTGGNEERTFENTLTSITGAEKSVFRDPAGGQEEPCVYGVARDITERKRTEELMAYQAYHDALTDLPNRALFQDRLEIALAQAKRNQTKLALVFCDLDRFKLVNDTLGHIKGDELLQQVARRLRACLRRSDTLARMGGDEFTVLLPNLRHRQDAAPILEKFLNALQHPFSLGGQELHISLSLGVAVYPSDGDTIEELLRHADIAMYQAKAAGRNTIRFFDPDMQAIVTERAALEADLRQGLLRKEFVLHYQAQADDGGAVTGAEALLRWRSRSGELVLPGEFIPLAEETGLIVPLGRWVLEAACVQLKAWENNPATAHLTLAVNVSGVQFRHPAFATEILTILEQTGAEPRKLKLELTESILLDNAEDAIAKMTLLKAQGVGFSLDDFGVGYSSLSYLKRLPLDQLKIDQSFVRDVLVDPNDATIARTIVSLAHSLGLAVIAEGVETRAQQNFLSNNGCHAFQGYLFGKPLPLDQFQVSIQAGAENIAVLA